MSMCLVRLLECILLAFFDGLLVVLHDVDGFTLDGRHDQGLYLTEEILPPS